MSKEVSYENNCIICGENGVFGICFSCIESEKRKKEYNSLREEDKKLKIKESEKIKKEKKENNLLKKEKKKILREEKKIWLKEKQEKVKENLKTVKIQKGSKELKKEYDKKYYEIYHHLKKYKERMIKKQNERKRKLGFIPLNRSFKGSEAHHIDKEHILYIPKEIHQSTRHDVHTGKNMSLINNNAIDWFKTNFVVYTETFIKE